MLNKRNDPKTFIPFGGVPEVRVFVCVCNSLSLSLRHTYFRLKETPVCCYIVIPIRLRL